MIPSSIRSLILLTIFSGSPVCLAEQASFRLLFQDDFERTETDDSKEEIGNGWKSNSAKRAKGNKQVDLKDGAMHITFHPAADHAVSVTHPAEFTDGKVMLRFMLPTEKDNLGLNFADLNFKEVHAGHLCMAKIFTNSVQINDLKTGAMDLKIRKARQSKSLTAEQQKILKTKTKRFKNKIEPGKWHKLILEIKGDTMSVTINHKKVAAFSSPGIGHPSKRTLRLAVPKEAVVDDVQVFTAVE
ncbi:MAG: family 16 glycoside hydrolase [Akkermansiaceae bacterium]